MKKSNTLFIIMLASIIISAAMFSSCKKCPLPQPPGPHYNLDVTLNGKSSFGNIKFRQDADVAKIIALDTKVFHLAPNHEYLLQRAVDAINEVDENCTSTTWLTLGKGLIPQSITTDGNGNGGAELWRDVTAIPTGSKFDIHFQIIDAATLTVVLASDCYDYEVR